MAWIQRPWNWTRQAWSWFGYIIESIFFNGNTWTDLYNFNNHCLLFVSKIVPFLFLPSQSSGGQKRWPSQMGAATLTQLYPANILTSYLTALATQRWELSIKTLKKNIAKYYCQYRIFPQLKSLVYADFVDSNGEPYLKDTREHTEARVYVKALWLWTGSMSTIKPNICRQWLGYKILQQDYVSASARWILQLRSNKV